MFRYPRVLPTTQQRRLTQRSSPDAVGGRFHGRGGLGNPSGEPAEQKLYKPLESPAQRVWAVWRGADRCQARSLKVLGCGLATTGVIPE
jgi:hypothetical protein